MSTKTQETEETPVVLMRNSERVSFRRCGFKWDLSYNQRLEPIRYRPALQFGSMIHECLEHWYPVGMKRGIHPAETFDRLWRELPDTFAQFDEEGERVSAYDMGIAMCEGYVDEYGNEEWLEVLAPEQSMEIDILDRQGNYICTWVGQGDLLIRDLRSGRIKWFEHKTSKDHVEEVRITSQYGDQALAYSWAGNIFLAHSTVLADGEFVDGVEFNFLRKGMPDERPKNARGHRLNKPSKDALVGACEAAGLSGKGTIATLSDRLVAEAGYDADGIAQLGEPSKNQPSPLFSRFSMDFSPIQMDNFNRRIRQEAWMMRQTREGKAPVLKNPTRDCGWDCDFREACELHEMGGDFETVLELDFTVWDPYENHELEKV